jgi:predicted DNA binding CopG/RHH family protein
VLLTSESFFKRKAAFALTNRSLDLFKRYARKRGARYQTMIRKLVDSYAQRTLLDKVNQ